MKVKNIKNLVLFLLSITTILIMNACSGDSNSNPNDDTVTIYDNTITITSNGETYSISIADASVTEANNDVLRELNFTVSLSVALSSDVTIDYTSSSGSATEVEDYTATYGSLTILAGDTSATISIIVVNETTFEIDETMSLLLSIPNDASLGNIAATATGTIINDDTPPTLSIANSSTTEGTGGVLTNLDFTVSLSEVAGVDITVDYNSADGSASSATDALNDYKVVNSTLTIPADTISATATVFVTSDSVLESDENLTMTLSNPINATLDASASVATGTIINDEVVTLTMLMEKSTIDLKITSDTRAYACAVLAEAGSIRNDDKVYLYEYELPSGKLLRTAEIFNKSISESGFGGEVRTCSVAPALDLGAIVVAFTVKQGVLIKPHLAVVDATTFESEQTRVPHNIDDVSIYKTYTSFSRVGDNFILLLSGDFFAGIYKYEGLPTPAFFASTDSNTSGFMGQEVSIVDFGGTAAKVLGASMDEYVDNSDPDNPRLLVSTSGYNTSDVSYAISYMNADGNYTNDDLTGRNNASSSVEYFGGEHFSRVFAQPYINLATNQISILTVPPTTMLLVKHGLMQLDAYKKSDISTTSLDVHNLVTGQIAHFEDSYFPITMDALLYENSDWLVVSRDASTSGLNIQRAAADYLLNGGSPKLGSSYVVPGAVFCGTEVVEVPIVPRDRFNDALKVQVTPSGDIAVAMVTCSDETLDQKLEVFVIKKADLPAVGVAP